METKFHLKKLIFSGFLLTIVACSGGDSSNNILSISTQSLSFILPGELVFPSDDPCHPGASIAEPRYQLDKVTTTWKGLGSYQPIIIKFEIPESGNVSESTCPFTGLSPGDLAVALGFTGGVITTDGVETSITEDSTCSFHCGGLSVKNKDAAFRTTVRAKLIGIHTDEKNVQRPLSASTVFYIENIP